MDERNVSQLCEMLDTIWAEMTGQEVVYQWVEWIQNSSLLHLWFDGRIMLGQDLPTYRGDRRAISRRLPLESTIPSMLSYSSKKSYQTFLDDLHTCMICLNQKKGKNSSFGHLIYAAVIANLLYVSYAISETFFFTMKFFGC
jgi:E3 ubiquitin-protein ligase RNF14